MKKIFIIFLLLNIAAIQYCDNIDIKKVLQQGNVSKLDSITIENINMLLVLNQEELTLLKNLIYAKHGYIFKEQEVINYFNKFSWYKPKKKDVIQDFSFNERFIIIYIFELEKRINMNIFTKLDYEKIITAEWIENFQAPGGIVDEYRFEKDYFFEYISKYGTCYIAGEWKIEDLKLFIKPGFIKYWEKEFVVRKEGLTLPMPDRENNQIIEKKISEKKWLYIGSFATLQFPQKIDNFNTDLITPISLILQALKIINNKIILAEKIIFYRGEFSDSFEID